jgi:hypothetical protein
MKLLVLLACSFCMMALLLRIVWLEERVKALSSWGEGEYLRGRAFGAILAGRRQ